MEILFWVIVAIILLAVIYGSLNVGKRKETPKRAIKFDIASGTKEHGIDLQARRKLYDDIT